jgi:uncharacterized Zn finger protein
MRPAFCGGRNRPTGASRTARNAPSLLGYLDHCDREELLELLKSCVLHDDVLRSKLMVRVVAASSTGAASNAKAKRAIERGIDADDFVPWNAMGAWENRAMGVVEQLERQFAQGKHQGLLVLVEHAISRVEGAVGQVDDSGGEIRMLLDRLEILHHDVAAVSQLDKEMLARRLYEWTKQSPVDVFYNAVERYADVLGPRGLDAYRTAVQTDFEKLPKLGSSDRYQRYEAGRTFIMTQMETLARQSGNVEDIVDVLKTDLSCADQYQRIAQEYKQAGDLRHAIEWAERGLAGFRDRDPRLVNVLADLHAENGNPKQAAELAWQNFVARPAIEAYKVLETHSTAASSWERWRARAHKLLRDQLKNPRSDNQRALLVELLLHDRDADAALSLARAETCADHGWRLLAQYFEKTRPLESAKIYTTLLESTLAVANKRAYQQAVHQLGEIRGLLKADGDVKQFTAVVKDVRRRHRLKRNLMAMMDAKEW